MMSYRPRIVVDTNVIFEGLTKQGGACGLIVEAWLAGLFVPCVSNATAYEYLDVFIRKLSPPRWETTRLLFQELLNTAEFVTVYYRWRPISKDPGDDHIIDCAMNAGAGVVTSNIKDFKLAESQLGLQIMTPLDFVLYLSRNTL
jgi:predicted nucleic acid-binding protein